MATRPQNPLVSVVIPCYNDERWIREAIDSVLAQTYSEIEIIVVDDGSTDASLEIIRTYGDAVQWESGPNCGGGAARNRGFARAKGEYIQYLDADDYLLPEKIEQQVEFLQETNLDVAYGDWRFQYHGPDGTVELGPVRIGGEHEDIVKALLGNWWVALNAFLFRRETVVKIGGWDETLRAAQDRDFVYRAALADATFGYQPGCHTIYRRYGNSTLSTGNRPDWLRSHIRTVEQAEQTLARQGRLTNAYRTVLAHSYFELVREAYDIDRGEHRRLLRKVLELEPSFVPRDKSVYNLLWKLVGPERTEDLAALYRHSRRQLKSLLSA